MMEVKLFEVRDRATFLPVLAVQLLVSYVADSADAYLMRRVGYARGEPYILLTRLAGDGLPAHYDPHAWGDRTLRAAHAYIIENWHNLVSGAVVDVEYILGENAAPKRSERKEVPAW